MDTPVGLPLLLSSRLPDFLPSYCPLPLAGGRWCGSTKGGGWARRAKGFKGFSPTLLCPRLRGKGGALAPKGGGPAGPAGCVEGLCRKVRRKDSKGSEGSKGKVDGAFGPEGCIEGLCPQRGNDSLHFRVALLLHPLLSLTHWIFRSLMLPYKSSSLVHPLLSLTHWIFRSLMLPYKSSSLVQNVFAVHRFAQGATALRS